MFKWLSNLTDSNEKQIQRLRPLIDEISGFEAEMKALSNEQLKAKTVEFKDYLHKATSNISEEIKQNQAEIVETKNKLNTSDEIERDELNTRIKSSEEKIVHLENEKRDIEKEALNELLPEAFAVVREAARRTIEQRHFDSQVFGGVVLHQGKIAEMKTGEGKTLAATLPLYLNSLTGKGCHLVTVNDYLSKRDAHWMGPVYHALGVSVGAIHSQTADNHAPSFVYDPAYDSSDKAFQYLRPVTRKEAYEADITYGTNNEFGFDYLRDNMVMDLKQCVQRPLNYAIVDEVDNLLIDEARTPLIISGPSSRDDGKLYTEIDSVVSRLKAKVMPYEPITAEEKEQEDQLEDQYDYVAYEKTHNVKDTRRGQDTLARAFRMSVDDLFAGLDNGVPFEEAKRRNDIVSIFRKSLLAHAWYRKDHEYIVRDNEVIIVDEFTGRLMFGRRYSDHLHQAIEAKERVKIQRENSTYATITFQNYFRMYKKLAGMTGTAQTEAEEFHKIYNLEVVQIPTNKPMIRQDFPDRIYKDEKSKFGAVVKEVVELNSQKRPILIGTVSIETSEMLADMLKRKGVTAKILNAKPENAQKEAGIVAEAGRLSAVTVATNMAGRGVDIILGGNPQIHSQGEWQKEHDEVIRLGGLHIVGTERHEARRIDNQLRGRAGRQGDPGSTRFFVSLDDDIMKRFGGDRIRGIMQMAGMDENTPIENRLVNRAIESAQVRVEGYHFDIRKQLVEFDDVVNRHRELIYNERRKLLGGADLKANILSMVKDEIHDIIGTHSTSGTEEWDIKGTLTEVNSILPVPPEMNTKDLGSIKPKELEEKLYLLCDTIYGQREQQYTPQNMRILERLVMLRVIDSLWVEHLTLMEERRQQAAWAGLKQAKPVDEYKRLGSEQWDQLMSTIRHEVANMIYHVAIVQDGNRQVPKQPAPSPMAQVMSGRNDKPVSNAPDGVRKVGRNDPCPCGSGKKYKHCHGK
jgi:preprotein translocase subunit SecA